MSHRWARRAAVAAVLASVALSHAADRKELTKVNVDELAKETQVQLTTRDLGQNGMNLVWLIPPEFLVASAVQSPDITKAQADEIEQSIRGFVILCVVRARVSVGGRFDFYDEATVRQTLTINHDDGKGKITALKETNDLTPTAAAFVAAMKPIMRAAMGQMGQNMHFYILSDKNAAGERMASPYEAGKFIVNLKPLAGEPGGNAEILFPLNALHVPRECAKCHQGNMSVHWKFCPHCGTELKP